MPSFSNLPTLDHRAKVICDSNSLLQELKFLHQTFGTMDAVNGRFSGLSIHLREPHHNIGKILLQ
jgi:hypothetical protein